MLIDSSQYYLYVPLTSGKDAFTPILPLPSSTSCVYSLPHPTTSVHSLPHLTTSVHSLPHPTTSTSVVLSHDVVPSSSTPDITSGKSKINVLMPTKVGLCPLSHSVHAGILPPQKPVFSMPAGRPPIRVPPFPIPSFGIPPFVIPTGASMSANTEVIVAVAVVIGVLLIVAGW